MHPLNTLVPVEQTAFFFFLWYYPSYLTCFLLFLSSSLAPPSVCTYFNPLILRDSSPHLSSSVAGDSSRNGHGPGIDNVMKGEQNDDWGVYMT
jgi:hypothetical protein